MSSSRAISSPLMCFFESWNTGVVILYAVFDSGKPTMAQSTEYGNLRVEVAVVRLGHRMSGASTQTNAPLLPRKTTGVETGTKVPHSPAMYVWVINVYII